MIRRCYRAARRQPKIAIWRPRKRGSKIDDKTHEASTFAISPTSSTSRLEYPHSLSYQDTNFTKVSVNAMPAASSKIDENLHETKSVETTSSFVWDRTPFMDPAAYSLIAATISS